MLWMSQESAIFFEHLNKRVPHEEVAVVAFEELRLLLLDLIKIDPQDEFLATGPRRISRRNSRGRDEEHLQSGGPKTDQEKAPSGRRLRIRGAVQKTARGCVEEDTEGTDRMSGRGRGSHSKASSGGEESDDELGVEENLLQTRRSDRGRNGFVTAEEGGQGQFTKRNPNYGKQLPSGRGAIIATGGADMEWFDEGRAKDRSRDAAGSRGKQFSGKELITRAGGRGKVLSQIGPGKPIPGQRRALPSGSRGGSKPALGKGGFAEEAFHYAKKQPRALEHDLASGGESSELSEGEGNSDAEADGFSSDEDLKLSLVERKDSPERDVRPGKKAIRPVEEEEEVSEEESDSGEVERQEAEARSRAEEEERIKEEEEKERQREIERLKEIEWQKEEARRRDEERKRGEERWREERQKKERERRKEVERQKREAEKQKEEKRVAEEKARAAKEAKEMAARQAQRSKMDRQLSVLERIQATIVAAKKARTGGVGPRRAPPKAAKDGPSPDELLIDARIVKKQRSIQTSPPVAPKLKTVRVSMLDIAAAAEEMSPSRPRSGKRNGSPGVNSPLGANRSAGVNGFEASRLGEGLEAERFTNDLGEGGGSINRGPSVDSVLHGIPQAKKEPRFMAGGSFSDDSDEESEKLFTPLDEADLLMDVDMPDTDGHGAHAPVSDESLPISGAHLAGDGVHMPMYGGVGLMGMKRKAFEEEAEGGLHLRGLEDYSGDLSMGPTWRGGGPFPPPAFGGHLNAGKGGSERASKQLRKLYPGGEWPNPSSLRRNESSLSIPETDWVVDGENSEHSGAAGDDLEADYHPPGAADVQLELNGGEGSEEDDVAGYLAVDHQEDEGLEYDVGSPRGGSENGAEGGRVSGANVGLGLGGGVGMRAKARVG
ncbi:hypothetical protein KFL_000140670 [Klebsormidium nitens]|uniref:Uncharacterized protein n=1 Tax=Klebsormidium nitens TaxID=105231 RepID=A0A1Y1HPK6_KLENI|nr:hypothetical protein KFL_000140670 [Klebsormidium nitens]|eukprot:GAQ78546.1 hypothetical protein KFL_000140670 [Klebsormidium nitens]